MYYYLGRNTGMYGPGRGIERGRNLPGIASTNEAAKAYTPRVLLRPSLDLLRSFIKRSPLVGHHNFLFVKTIPYTPRSGPTHIIHTRTHTSTPFSRVHTLHQICPYSIGIRSTYRRTTQMDLQNFIIAQPNNAWAFATIRHLLKKPLFGTAVHNIAGSTLYVRVRFIKRAHEGDADFKEQNVG